FSTRIFNLNGDSGNADLIGFWCPGDRPSIFIDLHITPRGKPVGPVDTGITGQNSYTSWFAGDPDMEGTYGNYDGPCPPWNDSILHHYHFTVYALDVATLGLTGPFTGQDALAAMDRHILASASHTGTYSMNPDVSV
ncbi:MAG: hypothetical protein AAGF10_07725, partial [Verrucomicrobiota bacterium]